MSNLPLEWGYWDNTDRNIISPYWCFDISSRREGGWDKHVLVPTVDITRHLVCPRSWGGCQMTFVSSHKGLINWPGLRCLQTCPATDIQGEGNILEMKHRRRMASHRQQHTGVRVGLRDCEWHHLSALCKLSGWPHSQLPQKLNINFFNKFLLSVLRMSQPESFTITSGGVLLSSRT